MTPLPGAPRSLLLPELMSPSSRRAILFLGPGPASEGSSFELRPSKTTLTPCAGACPKSSNFIFPFSPMLECLRRSSSIWTHPHLTLLCRRLPGSISQAQQSPSPPQAPGPTPDLRNAYWAPHGVERGVESGLCAASLLLVRKNHSTGRRSTASKIQNEWSGARVGS